MFEVISLNNNRKYKVYDIKETESGSVMFLIFDKHDKGNTAWRWHYANNFIPLDDVEYCIDLLS